MDVQHQNQLGYKFRGTTDVAVVTRAAIQAHSPQVYQLSSLCKHELVQSMCVVQSGAICPEALVLPPSSLLQIGLRLLFELKKRPDAAAVAQAKIFLLLANIHSEE